MLIGDMKQDCEKKDETTIVMTGDLQQSQKSSDQGPTEEEEVFDPALEMEFHSPVTLGLLFLIAMMTFLPSPTYQSLALCCLFVGVLARLATAEERYQNCLIKNKGNKTQSNDKE